VRLADYCEDFVCPIIGSSRPRSMAIYERFMDVIKDDKLNSSGIGLLSKKCV